MPTFKDPSATPTGSTGTGAPPASKPDLVVDISQGIKELLDSRAASSVAELREVVARCCLQACNCCLQIRVE